jgi:effector-binding domain-containing protein
VRTEVTVTNSIPLPLAAARVTTQISNWSRQFKPVLDKVYAFLRANEISHKGINIMIYRPREDGLVDIECGVQVGAPFAASGEVVCSATPHGVAATVAHFGSYAELGVSHRAVVEWARTNGKALTGTCWEIYGHWNDDPEKVRTDLFHLLS